MPKAGGARHAVVSAQSGKGSGRVASPNWLGAVVFTDAAIAMDRRRSGFPCRRSPDCTFIDRTTEARAVHERICVLPTSPLAVSQPASAVRPRAGAGLRHASA